MLDLLRNRAVRDEVCDMIAVTIVVGVARKVIRGQRAASVYAAASRAYVAASNGMIAASRAGTISHPEFVGCDRLQKPLRRALDDWHSVLVASLSSPASVKGSENARRPVFPREWSLFAYILPRETRERVYEPTMQDMREQYLLARRERGRWARRWIRFAFTVRFIAMVLDCLRMAFASKLSWLVPPLLRWLWVAGPGSGRREE